VSDSLPSNVPPGWYPDPSGQRQWRVWTGTRWSELTRPYGETPENTPLFSNFNEVRALNRALRYGLVGVLSGIGLAVSLAAHWTGTAHPAPHPFLVLVSFLAGALFCLGSVALGFAVTELNGQRTPVAFLPGINLLAFTALVTHKMGGRALQRVLSEIVLLGLFVLEFHAEPWITVALAIVALDEMRWTDALAQRLSGSSDATTHGIRP